VRDHTAELYDVTTGSIWRPRSGSMVNHRALTASLIDSREFLAARRRADTEVLAPAGTRIAFTGGIECNDHARIWDALDKIRAEHPDMVLLHGGSPRGAERIAACWADNRKVPQVVFKPDWNRDRNAAPFKRNDRLLEACRSASSCSPAWGFPPTSPTKRRSSAFRCGTSPSRSPETAALRRRFFRLFHRRKAKHFVARRRPPNHCARLYRHHSRRESASPSRAAPQSLRLPVIQTVRPLWVRTRDLPLVRLGMCKMRR
jgi:YspA, cpYpsA-related SLOG family